LRSIHAVLVRAALVGLVGAASAAAGADPVDLRERRARPVQVSFEVSPPDRPGQLDHRYSERALAWLEPGPGDGEVTIRVAGRDMERVLAAYEPVPGSFGDFVWIFDAGTGHVVSAQLAGAFLQHLSLGFLRTTVVADVAAQMTTLRSAGFLPPRSQLGHVIFEHCAEAAADCSMVAPHAYDPATGYVNAVGSITASAIGGFGTQTFSPLGEAVFTELSHDSAVSAPQPASPFLRSFTPGR
jgi:hypothetical protein